MSIPSKTYSNIRPMLLMSGLVVMNIAAWLLVWHSAKVYTFLYASGWLAYSFGLRHAVDADHVSAIDNVTRKLSLSGKQPIGVGLFFSLGHSTIVIILCALIAGSISYVQGHLNTWQAYGSVFGTVVSGIFLYVIGFINLMLLIDLFRRYRSSLGGNDSANSTPIMPSGLLGKVLRPVLDLVSHSWQMYFVGFLFGLGFDTATEVGILSVSAKSISRGISFWVVMLLPLLFTCGMTLVDSLDGIVMSRAYGWVALNKPRQFRYTFAITMVSVCVAFAVGTWEMIAIAGDKLPISQVVRRLAATLDSGLVGLGIIATFLAIWAVAVIGSKHTSERLGSTQ